MADRSPIPFFVLALAISWLVWAVPAQAETEKAVPAQAEAEKAVPAQAEAEKAEAEQPAKAKRPRAPRRQPNTARALEAMWWNDPALVEHLSLSDASRSAMDGHYKVYAEKTSPRADRDLQTAFLEALREGDWKEARKRARELAAEASRPLEAQGELKISVLSLLSDEQRSKLVEKNPELLSRVWSSRRPAVGGSRKSRRRPKGE